MVKMLKKVIDYPITLNSFVYNAREFVNNIFVGPQGQLLETIKDFNEHYNTTLGVTKSFTLKPGAYDLIKKAYADFVLRWDMKPRGIDSIFRRIDDYKWRARNFKNDLQHINTLMLDLKVSGLRWQDNTEDLGNEIERLKSNITNALEDCKTLYPNVNIDVKMIPVSGYDVAQSRRGGYGGRISFPNDRITEPLTEANAIADYIVTFVIYIKKPIMTVHAINANGTVDMETIQGTGDVLVFSGARMLSIISRCWGKEVLPDTNATGNYSHYLDGVYLDNMGINKHPYISSSSDKYTFDLDPETCNNVGNICTGNMAAELKSTLINGQIMAHIEYIYQWLTNYYIPQTNPLNRLYKFRNVGRNNEMDNLAADYSAMSGLILQDRDPYSCTLSEKIARQIRIYSKKRTEYEYSSRFQYSSSSPEFIERSIEYINHIDMQDLPCNECIFSGECKQENNIVIFLQDTLSPMEEAYLGMFVEMREFEAAGGSREARPIHFVEELIKESFRWAIDIEHDKLLLAYQISKKAIENSAHHVYTNNKFFDFIIHLKGTELNDLEALVTLSEVELQNMSLSALASYKCKLKIEQVQKPTSEFNNALEDSLEDLDLEDLTELAVAAEIELTDEERTLRWASQLGGASNL